VLPFKIDLSGKTAVVTGGGGVLCGAMAEALAECDANVAVLSRKLENAVTVADRIIAAGGSARPYACDVTDRDSIVSANAAIEAEYGPCDILINGAGGNAPSGTASVEVMQPEHLQPADGVRTFYELEPEGIDFVFDVNFKGTVAATQVFTRSMAERQRGCVINISSMSAFTPLTKVGAYSAAKGAVNNFTEWLAVHLAEMNIRVNAIAPGFFLTRQNEALLTNPDGTYSPRGNTIVAQTPMRRMGRADELIGCLLWLVSDEAASFVTGTVIAVDGGFNAFGGV
jgi:NAD(P)-dependent dehydrogenase (short-subunit alcohol dehydrogenase family)|tara:strand:- start:3281 stop:4132 length:852 start_codon:yes stop_codon:yes gene_type:complete